MSEPTKEKIPGTPSRQWTVYLWIAITVILASSFVNWLNGIKVQEQKEVVQQNSTAQAQANLDSNICKKDPEEPLCKVAKQILENPTEPVEGVAGPRGEKGERGADSTVPGRAGKNGKDAVGEKGADSTVAGPKGADSTVTGPRGADSTVAGPAGRDGESIKGEKGADSTVPGPPGKSIVGPSGPAGADSTVPGPKGEPGSPGSDGRGIQSISCGSSNDWLVTFTDGTSQAVAGPCRAETVTVSPKPTE